MLKSFVPYLENTGLKGKLSPVAKSGTETALATIIVALKEVLG